MSNKSNIDDIIEEEESERNFDAGQETVKEEVYVQKDLAAFIHFPKQYILLNCNPVIAVPSMGDEKPIRKQEDVDQTI